MSDLTGKAAYVLAAAKERIKNNFNEGENMSDLFNSVCITSVAPTVSLAFGMNAVGTESENPVLARLSKKNFPAESPTGRFFIIPTRLRFGFSKNIRLSLKTHFCALT